MWMHRAMGPDGRIRSPNGDPGGYSARDFLNGLEPWDMAHRFDEPIPGKAREVFKCHGEVTLGYKQNCSDYTLFTGERWKKAWAELWDTADLKKDPRCYRVCKGLIVSGSAAVIVGCPAATAGQALPGYFGIFSKLYLGACEALGMSAVASFPPSAVAVAAAGAYADDVCRTFCVR